MASTVIGIVGSYRKGHIIDSAVDAALRGASQNGANTEKIYLQDKNINFCTNCRKCTLEKIEGVRGSCIHNDDMSDILWKIENAEAVVLASPINFSTVTALMKKFIERLIVYSYWSYGEKTIPKLRIKNPTKKALLITSSACPAILGKVLMPNALSVMKSAAKCMGATVNQKLYYGLACGSSDQLLTEKQILKAKLAGQKLVI